MRKPAEAGFAANLRDSSADGYGRLMEVDWSEEDDPRFLVRPIFAWLRLTEFGRPFPEIIDPLAANRTGCGRSDRSRPRAIAS
jgi:hypothetical protein